MRKPQEEKNSLFSPDHIFNSLFSFLVLPKAKPGARTEALFSFWRQTEGTFKAWLGMGRQLIQGPRVGSFSQTGEA